MSHTFLYSLAVTINIHNNLDSFSCTVNKSKVYYGIPRDPDLTAALAELEKEEADAAATVDDDKPKVSSFLIMQHYCTCVVEEKD